MKRPPIVVVMGHVDHGKTTLLDYIRKANVAAKEAGGITQSIGAYEISHNNQRITFIDTPGHEAFSMMRQRGAKVADLGILVVAVDDSVQNQTKEAFKILQDSQTPIIVAISKIDKPEMDINKTKNDLAQAGILLEGYGGNISWQAVSAKTGEGVNELLDLILLATEMDPPAGGLEYDSEAKAEGFVLESKLDSQKGIVVSVIVKNGVLKVGEEIFASGAKGKIKSLENFLGKRIKEAIPSMPVLILGFENLPKVGDGFQTEKSDSNIANSQKEGRKILEAPTEENTVNLILKADTFGSLEALSAIVKNLPSDKKIRIVDETIGDITDGDIKLALSTECMIIGFKVSSNKAAENLARVQSVRVITSDVVYDLVKAIEEFIKKSAEPIILGDLQILAVFNQKGEKQVIGGKVIVGEIKNNSNLEIQRNGQLVGEGKIVNLQQKKLDVKKVNISNECGLLFNSSVNIIVGDHLISKQ